MGAARKAAVLVGVVGLAYMALRRRRTPTSRRLPQR
jgi:hypothetical protein